MIKNGKILLLFMCLSQIGLAQNKQNLDSLKNRSLVVCEDTTICEGVSVDLWAEGAIYYLWYPPLDIINYNSATPTVTPLNTRTYYVHGYTTGTDEQVYNGDFELGNVGFTSAYTYINWLWNEGTYYVGTDAQTHHSNFVGHDHTTGSGNFMMVNGFPGSNVTVWSQNITVTPNTDYAFSCWVSTLAGEPHEVAQLQFSINNIQIGDVFPAPSNYNNWQRFYQIWNSGSNTTATIKILNQNTVLSGNDFGLDDISFVPLVDAIDSVTITVINTTGLFIVDTACLGVPYNENGFYIPNPQLGITNHNLTFQSYQGCDSIVVLSLITLTPDTSSFRDTICSNEPYNINGFNFTATHDTVVIQVFTSTKLCDSTVTLYLTVFPASIKDTNVTICQGETFSGMGFNESTTGIYTQTYQATNGCDSNFTLNLTVESLNSYTVSGGGILCEGNEGFYIFLNGSDSLLTYTIYCSSILIETIIGTGNPITMGPYVQSGNYTIEGSNENNCNLWMDGTVIINVIPNPPDRPIEHD